MARMLTSFGIITPFQELSAFVSHFVHKQVKLYFDWAGSGNFVATCSEDKWLSSTFQEPSHQIREILAFVAALSIFYANSSLKLHLVGDQRYASLLLCIASAQIWIVGVLSSLLICIFSSIFLDFVEGLFPSGFYCFRWRCWRNRNGENIISCSHTAQADFYKEGSLLLANHTKFISKGWCVIQCALYSVLIPYHYGNFIISLSVMH